jgi:hypothetical protein
MKFDLISRGGVCPKLCLGEMSVRKCGSEYRWFVGWKCRQFIQVGLSMDSGLVAVGGCRMDAQLDFGVAFECPLALKGISGWCRNTAVMLTRPMKNIKSVVPSRDYCNEGLTPKGCPSKGRKMARQGGGNIAQKQRFTSGVHQGAFFAPGGAVPRPRKPRRRRLRECLSLGARDTLEALEAVAATPARAKGRDASPKWERFIARTNI